MERFNTNQKCHDYLVQTRWNGRPQCPKCDNNQMNYYLKSRNIYKCSKCRKEFSILQGTILEKTRLPLTTWFLAMYLFTTKKRGVSSCQMAKWLGVRQPTAWFMLQRLREALKDENEIVLSGIVEADETFVGPKIDRDKRLQVARRIHEEEQDKIHGYSKEKRLRMGVKMRRGRKKGETKDVLQQRKIDNGGKTIYSAESNRVPFERGAVILGMVEKGGKIVMKKLGVNAKSTTKKIIYPHLIRHITSDSILVTDQLSVYDDTKKIFADHQTVNHNIGYVVNGIHSNNIENAWNHLKKMVDGTFFHLSYTHFDRYLNENTYRWNRRKESEKILFEDFIPLAFNKRISYERLTAGETNKMAA